MSSDAAPLPLPPLQARDDEQLAEAAKVIALGGLVRGFAHEINNPLFGILGLVEFLVAEVEPGTRAHERATLIQQSGLEIKGIVQALLGFAREDPQEHRRVSLQQTAASAVELLRSTNAAKTIEIVEVFPAEPVLVDGRAERFAQIFLHLLVNAHQALPGGGTVTVELSADGDWAVATVSDTGPGMPVEIVDRAFDPFFSTKHDGACTGLGLTVSRQIARSHGGDLIALPAAGRGATFVLRLPRAPEGRS